MNDVEALGHTVSCDIAGLKNEDCIVEFGIVLLDPNVADGKRAFFHAGRLSQTVLTFLNCALILKFMCSRIMSFRTVSCCHSNLIARASPVNVILSALDFKD
jgi:hypothetical protein